MPNSVTTPEPRGFHLRRARCGVHSIVIVRGELAWAQPMPCRSWACEDCSRRLAARWHETTTHHRFVPRVMLTVTLDPDALDALGILHDPIAQRDWFTAKLTRLYRRLRRAGYVFRYLRVFEYHKGQNVDRRGLRNHRLHAHIAFDGDVPHGGYSEAACKVDPTLPPYRRRDDKLARWARALGFGRSMSQGIAGDPSSALAYVLKYVTKGDGARHRVRLFATTRGLRHRAAVRMPDEFCGPLDWHQRYASDSFAVLTPKVASGPLWVAWALAVRRGAVSLGVAVQLAMRYVRRSTVNLGRCDPGDVPAVLVEGIPWQAVCK